MRPSSVYRLLGQISFRDWKPASLVRKAGIDYPNQLRLYSNGSSSAMLVVHNDKVVDLQVARETYAVDRPIEAVWPLAEPYVKLGSSIIFVGGVNPQVQRVRRGVPAASAMDDPSGSQSAISLFPLADGTHDIACYTKVSADLLGVFSSCTERRVPVEILDELNTSLALTAPSQASIEPGALAVTVLIFEHVIYVALFSSAGLLCVSDLDLRVSEGVASPEYARVAQMIQHLRAQAQEGGVADNGNVATSVYDMTWRLAEPAWQQALADDFARMHQGSVTCRLPSDLAPGIVQRFQPQLATTPNNFPLPILAFLPPEALT